jgi:hypothetical protein
VRRLVFITAILATVALIAAPVALITAPAAQADGDPASDVLVDYSLFNPVDSGISQSSQTELEAVLTVSRRAGFPIRVALIASQTDLGTATAFWSKNPKKYAGYLGYELSELYSGQVLVVMPNGFGLYGPRTGSHVVSPAESGVNAVAPGPGEQLATAALSAVPLLARAAGHPIPASALARAEHEAAPAADDSGGTSLGLDAVIALVLGVLLIAFAWTLSLRTRPLQPGRRLSS